MRIRYEIPPDVPPSHAVATVLAGFVGKAPTEIRPISRFVDLDALDRLLDSQTTSDPWSASVVLALDACVLTIDDSGVIHVETDVDADGPPAQPNRVPETEAVGRFDVDRSVPDGDDGQGGGGRGESDASNVLLLAPSASAAEASVCEELRPGGRSCDSTVLELSFGQSPRALDRVGVDAVETLERWRSRHEQVGLCIDSLSTLVKQVGLARTFRFVELLARQVSRLDVDAHYHADPNEHDLQTTYTLEALADSIVVAGDVAVSPPRY